MEQIKLSSQPGSPEEGFEFLPKCLGHRGAGCLIFPVIIDMGGKRVADSTGDKAKYLVV